MKAKLPILIIIPHGGRTIPDEMSGYEQIDDFGIFIESDPFANELFNFDDAAVKLETQISRLFVDIDRPYIISTSYPEDGVIKKKSQNGRKIFKETIFPDEIAIANILRRYYDPFHNTIQNAVESDKIKLILECHTMMPVGQRLSKDAGQPRPLINVENIIVDGLRSMRTCPVEQAEFFISCFKKYFSNEDFTVSEKFSLNKPQFEGYILEKYGLHKIPMLRFSVSTSLYLNDSYFNYDSLTVDTLRINDLKNRIWQAIEKYASRYLQ